jgi:hypothetical protein
MLQADHQFGHLLKFRRQKLVQTQIHCMVTQLQTLIILEQLLVCLVQMRVSAARAGNIARPAHAGWQLTKTGSGGRAGRVQHETLVALKTMSSDGSDDAVLPDLAILIGTQPSSASGNSTANDVKTFSVVATTVPAGGSLSYIWQKWGGSAFANLSNAGAYSNTTTATLSVKANTASNGEIYRARISATGATAVFSSNAVITITT